MFQQDINALLRSFHAGIDKLLYVFSVKDQNSRSVQFFIKQEKNTSCILIKVTILPVMLNTASIFSYVMCSKRNTSLDISCL